MEVNIFIHDEPAYSAQEAAAILAVPSATVKSWCFGQTYHLHGEKRQFQPVIRAADKKSRLISFANLCELHVLSAIRRYHRIPMPRVRESVEYVRKELGADRPLIDSQFMTNGIDLFVEHASKLLNVSKQGQEALRGEFEAALARIERNKNGSPIRLFPFSRSSMQLDEQPRIVVVDPRLSFGRPVLTGSAVPTRIIVDRFQAGDSMSEMAEDYGVGEAEIEEAIRFEQLRRAA